MTVVAVCVALAACGRGDRQLLAGEGYTLRVPDGWSVEAIGDSVIARGHTLVSPHRRSTVTVCVFGIEVELDRALTTVRALGLTSFPEDRKLAPHKLLGRDGVKASYSDGRTAGTFYAFLDGGSTVVITSRHLLSIPDDIDRVAASLEVDGSKAHLSRKALTDYVANLIDHANTHYPQQPESGITLLGYALSPDSSAIVADIQMDNVELSDVVPSVVAQSTKEMQADVEKRTGEILFSDPLLIVARADSLTLRYRYLTSHKEQITTFDISLR